MLYCWFLHLMQWIVLFSPGLRKQSEQEEWHSVTKKWYRNENQKSHYHFIINFIVLSRSIWRETKRIVLVLFFILLVVSLKVQDVSFKSTLFECVSTRNIIHINDKDIQNQNEQLTPFNKKKINTLLHVIL